jgi:hypothetical protein
MHAREIAKFAHVYLENFGAPTPKRHRVLGQFIGESIPPLPPKHYFLSMRFDHLLTFTNLSYRCKVRNVRLSHARSSDA